MKPAGGGGARSRAEAQGAGVREIKDKELVLQLYV